MVPKEKKEFTFRRSRMHQNNHRCLIVSPVMSDSSTLAICMSLNLNFVHPDIQAPAASDADVAGAEREKSLLKTSGESGSQNSKKYRRKKKDMENLIKEVCSDR